MQGVAGRGGRGVRAVATLGLAVAVLGAAGCVHRYRNDWVAPGFRTAVLPRIALVPLVNLSGYPQAGEIVAQLLGTELYRRGFRLIASWRVREALQAAEIDPELAPEAAMRVDWAAFGRRLGVDGILVGSVDEMRYKRDLGEDPVVGYTVRLLDTASGRVLWTASHSRAEHGIFYHKHHLHENVQRIAHAMLETLLDEAGPPAAVGMPEQGAPAGGEGRATEGPEPASSDGGMSEGAGGSSDGEGEPQAEETAR